MAFADEPLPDSLPSRPTWIETTVVTAAVLAAGGVLATGLARLLDDRAGREAAVERALAGADAALDEAARFAARDRLVEVHLARVRDALETLSASDAAPLATDALVELPVAVEALTASEAAGREDVRDVLSALVERLGALEHRDGWLDPDLELARELARAADPAKESPR